MKNVVSQVSLDGMFATRAQGLELIVLAYDWYEERLGTLLYVSEKIWRFRSVVLTLGSVPTVCGPSRESENIDDSRVPSQCIFKNVDLLLRAAGSWIWPFLNSAGCFKI